MVERTPVEREAIRQLFIGMHKHLNECILVDPDRMGLSGEFAHCKDEGAVLEEARVKYREVAEYFGLSKYPRLIGDTEGT